MLQIAVVPYQTSWQAEYEAQVAQLLPKIQDQIARIDHVGSTSTPGMAAKDIIDIQIAVPAFTQTFIDLRLFGKRPFTGQKMRAGNMMSSSESRSGLLVGNGRFLKANQT